MTSIILVDNHYTRFGEIEIELLQSRVQQLLRKAIFIEESGTAPIHCINLIAIMSYRNASEIIKLLRPCPEVIFQMIC